MSDDIKKEARKQYLHYFRVWFIVVGILLAVTILMGVKHAVESNVPRANHQAPAERVYDYADVLTDAEEENLRRRIAEVESTRHIDIVLVTFNQSVEGGEAMRQYGYRSVNWEQNMMDYADNFWDQNQYGYNQGFEGDGCILVHNWYEGQNGEHLSTSGRVEDRFSDYDIDRVLDAVDRYYATDPYRAYAAYIDKVDAILSGGGKTEFSWFIVLLVPVAAALIYALYNLAQNRDPGAAAKAAGGSPREEDEVLAVVRSVLVPHIVTILYALAMLLFQKMSRRKDGAVTASTYVEGGRPVMKARADDFIRKSVVTRKIETSSGGSGGGSSHSGGGGHHTSSSGASHGGGSHRH